jgi:hypothetical protein
MRTIVSSGIDYPTLPAIRPTVKVEKIKTSTETKAKRAARWPRVISGYKLISAGRGINLQFGITIGHPRPLSFSPVGYIGSAEVV